MIQDEIRAGRVVDAVLSVLMDTSVGNELTTIDHATMGELRQQLVERVVRVIDLPVIVPGEPTTDR